MATRTVASASVATTIASPEQVESPTSRRVTLALRCLQLATSATALALFAGGFKGSKATLQDSNGEAVDVTVYYGGPSLSFALLVTFSASFFTLAWIACVHFLRWKELPFKAALGVDAGFTVFQLSAGCALAGSDYVRYCDLLSPHVDCFMLKTGAALCLASFVAFLAALAWTAWRLRAWGTHHPGNKGSGQAHKAEVRRMRGISNSPPVLVRMPDEYGDVDMDVMDHGGPNGATTPDAAYYHRQQHPPTSP